jgi:2,3-bisphosphoglycerate-dependent phosphoglycerate mutase
MTNLYFVRHAEPNYENHDDRHRELTEKGMRDREAVTEYLMDKEIHAVLSSPYQRAVDTVKHFADARGMEIELVEDFRERKVDSVWIEDFNAFAKMQWADFSYKMTDGECLREVQERNIAALMEAARRYEGKNVIVGSHGTAIGTIIHFFDPSFGYEDFRRIQKVMPMVVKFSFEGERCVEIEKYDPLEKRFI